MVCGPTDCMTCRPGHVFEVKYDDGTGICHTHGDSLYSFPYQTRFSFLALLLNSTACPAGQQRVSKQHHRLRYLHQQMSLLQHWMQVLLCALSSSFPCLLLGNQSNYACLHCRVHSQHRAVWMNVSHAKLAIHLCQTLTQSTASVSWKN